MRACARVALASIAVSASFSLSGCAAIEELKETFLRWVESQKLPSGRSVSADELPEATPVVPPEKTPKEPSKRHPQPKDAARVANLIFPALVFLPSASALALSAMSMHYVKWDCFVWLTDLDCGKASPLLRSSLELGRIPAAP